MASPFAKFRKNQKFFMAVFGALLMVSWLVLDPRVLQTFTGGGPVDAEAVTTRYGTLKDSDLHKLAQQRDLANKFINNARQRANLQPFVTVFGNPNDESHLVETMIKARRAEEMGIHVPDNRIIAMLDELTDKQVDGAGFSEIAQQLGVAEAQIMEALRHELMAQQYEQLIFPATQIQTPVSRWNMYQSLNREVSVEYVPLPVDRFIAKVPKPDEVTLLAFFDKYRLNEATYYGIEPGFKQPHKVAFQYFKVKIDDFTSQVQVSEEEIVAAYERDKDTLYRNRPASSLFNNPFTTPGAALESGIPTEEESPAAVEPVTGDEAPSEPAAPVTETPATETPASETPEATAPSTEPAPSTEQTPATEAPGEKAPEGTPQTSTRRSPFHLASYRQQADETPAADEPPATETATESPAADAPASEAAATSSTAETTTPAATDAAAPPAAADTAPPADEEPLANEEWLPPGELQDGPEPEIQPLWQVREQVRQSVAREKALPMMEKVMDQLMREMRRYEAQWRGWDAQKATNPDAPAPTPPDFGDLARKNGVESKQTSLLARDALLFSEEHTLGNSFIGQTPTESQAVVNIAYGRMPLFQPQHSQDVQGNHYLFWKTEEKDATIPTFEEVRADVEDAWVREEARKLALEEANKLADEARKSNKSLTEVFANRADLPVTTTRPFTWKFGGFMFGQQQIPITTSQVEGIENAGDGFMRTVYGLSVGEIATTMNETKKDAYIVRLVNTTPDLNVLHTMFMSTPYTAYGRAGENDARLRQANWLQELNAQANVQWLRAPQGLQ